MTPDDLRAQLEALVRGEGVTSLSDLFPELRGGEESRLLDNGEELDS